MHVLEQEPDGTTTAPLQQERGRRPPPTVRRGSFVCRGEEIPQVGGGFGGKAGLHPEYAVVTNPLGRFGFVTIDSGDTLIFFTSARRSGSLARIGMRSASARRSRRATERRCQ